MEDNGYAISVPVEKQTAGGDISKLVTGFPDLKIFNCDGTDFVASYATMSEAVDHCRREQSPVLVHATCIRPYSHSLSDDEKLYKTKAERADEARRDPIVTFPEWLDFRRRPRSPRPGIADARSRSRSAAGHRASAESRAAAQRLRAALSLFGSRRSHISGIRRRAEVLRRAAHHGRRHQSARCMKRCGATSGWSCSARTSPTRAATASLTEVKGKGGVFKATQGLQIVIRRRALLQYADRRSRHRRARHRHGDARLEAGRRDSVFRLHLAGDDADSR